jgi:phospholipase/carboxylesterase
MWLFARAIPDAGRWLIVSPRGVQPDDQGGYVWHRDAADKWPDMTALEEGAHTLARLVTSLPELYAADADRVYLIGFSQGAATSLALAGYHAGLTRGIASLLGFLPQVRKGAGEPPALAGLPVFMAAGLRDPRIPLEVARRSAQRLRAAGARLDYREYDTGHKMNADGMRDLTEWWMALA